MEKRPLPALGNAVLRGARPMVLGGSGGTVLRCSSAEATGLWRSHCAASSALRGCQWGKTIVCLRPMRPLSMVPTYPSKPRSRKRSDGLTTAVEKWSNVPMEGLTGAF